MRTIEIILDARGGAKVETRGCSGDSCREASRFVEQALGRTTAETLTAGFHQRAAEGEPLRQSS